VDWRDRLAARAYDRRGARPLSGCLADAQPHAYLGFDDEGVGIRRTTALVMDSDGYSTPSLTASLDRDCVRVAAWDQGTGRNWFSERRPRIRQGRRRGSRGRVSNSEPTWGQTRSLGVLHRRTFSLARTTLAYTRAAAKRRRRNFNSAVGPRHREPHALSAPLLREAVSRGAGGRSHSSRSARRRRTCQVGSSKRRTSIRQKVIRCCRDSRCGPVRATDRASAPRPELRCMEGARVRGAVVKSARTETGSGRRSRIC